MVGSSKVSGTFFGSTFAFDCLAVAQAIINGELRLGIDPMQRHNYDTFTIVIGDRFTVRLTTVVDEPRRVAENGGVNYLTVFALKHEDVFLTGILVNLFTPIGFFHCYDIPDIFHQEL